MNFLNYKPRTIFKKLLTVLMYLIIANYSNAQLFEATETNFIPPSPNAASLVNFTEAAVDHKSGVMNLSIPLVNVQSKTLSAGLQASYSARGIRLKEEASNIGLGWSLTGYGVITRTVLGKPDETTNTGFFYNNFDWRNSDLEQAYSAKWDLEPDLYTYNFGEYSGKFVMNQEQEIIPLLKTDLKFKKTPSGWEVIEPNGTKHEFHQKETSSRWNENPPTTLTTATAWYQTKVKSFDNSDFITYSYVKDGSSYSLSNGSNTRIVTKANDNCSASTVFSSNTTDFSAQNTYLKSIQTVFHKIELTYSDRLDISTGKKLDLIELKNKATDVVLKTYDFDYTYFGPSNQKLKLDQIQEKSSSGETIPPFIFTYNTNDINDKKSSRMDHWGFQNLNGSLSTADISTDESSVFFNNYKFRNPSRQADDSCLDGLLTTIDYPTGWFETFQYETNDAGFIGGANTHEFWFDSRSFVLIANQENKSVEGTFTIEEEFREMEVQVFLTSSCQFEGDCLLNFLILDPNGNPIYSGGGNGADVKEFTRLKPGVYTAKIENYEPNIETRLIIHYKKKIETSVKRAVTVGGARIKSITNPDGTRTFDYSLFKDGIERSSGVLIDRPSYKRNMFTTSPNCFECPGTLYSSNSLNSYFSDDVLIYSQVKETLPNESHINFYFNYQSDTYSSGNLPGISRQHARGYLIGKNYRDNLNNIVKEESYDYTFEQQGTINAPVIEWPNPTCFEPEVDLYNHILYWKKLNKTIVKDYDTDDNTKSISKTTFYTYESNDLYTFPKRTYTTNSNGKIHETRYKYYDQYATSNLVSDEDNEIKNWLESTNIIEPWQTISLIYDNAEDTSPTQVDGTRFYYDNYETSGNNLVYYPKTFQRYERTWDANGTLQTGSWKEQYVIDSYNTSVGKLTSITVDGWSDATTYTWTSTGNLNTKTYKNFVTDYNYHPNTDLLSEIIEPDGLKTTFTYDDFMRLDVISSRAGKVKTDYNYSYKPNFIEEITTFNDTGTSNDITNTVKTIFDGLGRDIQIDQIGHKWNSSSTNITVLKEYNNRGLLEKVYEPDDDATSTADKFTEYTYYPDPLARVQTVKDPMGFVTTSSFGTNATEIDGFVANTLIRETITDADEISTSTYTDKLGRVVASRTFTSDEESITYTNYDDKSRVSTIIPPGAAIDDAGLIYQYTYDGADNVEKVKFPDKGLMVYKYDDRNLQTSMQDANLKAKGKWLNSIYDDYGRLHQQGFSTSNNGLVTDLLIHNYYDKNDNINTVNAAEPIYTGKLHKSKVNILNGFNKSNNYLTTTYALDSYGRVNAESNSSNHIGFAESTEYNYDMADNILKDKHTVGNTTATETFDFDPKGRLISNDFELTGKGKKTVASYAGYSPKDEVIIKKIGSNDYNNDDILDFLQTLNYGYNHNGWLSSINGGSISGTKNNCSTISTTTSNDLFALDIRYNNAALSGSTNRKNGNISEIYWQVNERKKNAYRFQYDYLNRLTEAKHYEGTTQAGHYDTAYSYDERGNIMSLKRNGLTGNWTSCAATQIDNLSYMYAAGTNKLSRVFDNECGEGGLRVNPITNTMYDAGYIISDAKTNIEGGTNNSSNVQFKAGNYITLEGGFSYDLNGNNSGFNAILDDCTTNSNLTNYGFKGAESSYRYDGNGNLILDSQKQLNIAYNHLNLPYQAKKDNNNKIEWKYTADGRKLQKKVTENGTAKIKNYLGNMEYTQSGTTHTLEAAYHSEGRVLNNGDWEYNLKDHLGNVRIVFKENGSSGNAFIMQENHYYPFGMQLNGRWKDNQTVKNDYLYNGKELNAEIGLDWSDYGFRQYDAAIGRFTGVDPISDQFAWVSTYNYAENSPIANIDLWGLQAVYSAAAAAHSGEGAKFAKQHPKAATAIAIGFFAAPVGFSIAAEAGSAATVAFVSNEIKDEVASKLTNGGSDFLDLSKNLKNLGKYGIKKLDIGGGANSKYSDALNVDPNAETGFKGTLGDFVEQTGGDVKFADIVVDNPQVSFLKDAENLLEEGGTITVRGTMSNKYFNKVVNKKAEGIENFNVSSPKEIPNKGFNRTDGNSITGQMYEIKINH